MIKHADATELNVGPNKPMPCGQNKKRSRKALRMRIDTSSSDKLREVADRLDDYPLVELFRWFPHYAHSRNPNALGKSAGGEMRGRPE